MASPEGLAGQALADRVLAHLTEGPTRLGGMRLLAVDGPSGAGKSTLASEVAGRTGAAVISVDELLDGWYGGIEAAVADLVRDVLLPLSQGRPGSYRGYDWHRAEFGATVTVPPGALLVVEGVGAGARALDPFRTTLVWLDAPPEVRRRRALERDGDSYAPFWEHWAALEEQHFAAEQTSDRADLRAASGFPDIGDGPPPRP